MNDPVGAREALLIEAVGDVVQLMDVLERLSPEIRGASRELDRARESLRVALENFEPQLLARMEKAKVSALKYIAVRTEEAARRSIDLHTRALTEAAQTALRTELLPHIRRLQALMVPPPKHHWESFLTHAAAVSVSSAVTLGLALWLTSR